MITSLETRNLFKLDKRRNLKLDYFAMVIQYHQGQISGSRACK